MSPVQAAVKRAIDITVSLVTSAILSPLFFIIVLAIRLTSSGPALFRQTRVGKDSKPFTCYKFRTMYVEAADIRNPDGSTSNAEDDLRVTCVG